MNYDDNFNESSNSVHQLLSQASVIPWKISNFNIRKKKTTQRLLFSFTQKIYPSLIVLRTL